MLTTARFGVLCVCALAMVVACGDGGDGPVDDDPATSARGIGHGLESARPGVVALTGVVGGKSLLGSGSFVAPRCILTADHVASAGVNRAVQTTGAGVHIFDAADLPKERIQRISRLPDVTPAEPGEPLNDLAFVWVTGKHNHDVDAPKITDYGALTPGYAEANVRQDVSIQGFGDDCELDLADSIQRAQMAPAAGYTKPTTQDKAKVQTAGLKTALYLAPPLVCSGDSGGPMETNQLIAVIKGEAQWANGVSASVGTSLKPYQPWVENQLAKFCKPTGGVGVQNSGMGASTTAHITMTIAGGAFYHGGAPWAPAAWETSEVDCPDSYGCGAPLRADDPNYEGITVTATVTPDETQQGCYDLCTYWYHGECDNEPAGNYGDFKSETCSFELHPTGEEHAQLRAFYIYYCGDSGCGGSGGIGSAASSTASSGPGGGGGYGGYGGY